MRGTSARRRLSLAVLALVGLLVTACGGSRPAPIAYGADQCANCHMQISERRFSAVLVTSKGRTVKFDSIECLAEYYRRAASASGAASIWVADYRHPGQMIPADSARFADLGAGHAPMGRSHGWAAVPSVVDAVIAGITDTAALKRWSEVQ
jgi:copper chaperone NosL